MAYDSEPSERTITRDRVMRLRDHIAALPPEQFNMAAWSYSLSDYGTIACIGGWACNLFGIDAGPGDHEVVAPWLGLTEDQAWELMYAQITGPERSLSNTTRDHAVQVLDHYLATGTIDWSVAK